MVNNSKEAKERFKHDEANDVKSNEVALWLPTLVFWLSYIFHACFDTMAPSSTCNTRLISMAPASFDMNGSKERGQPLQQDELVEPDTKPREGEAVDTTPECIKRLLTVASLPQRFEVKRRHHRRHSRTCLPKNSPEIPPTTPSTTPSLDTSLSPQRGPPSLLETDTDGESQSDAETLALVEQSQATPHAPHKPTLSDTVDIVDTVRRRLQQRHKNDFGQKVRDLLHF
jgi:hypothetical protein